MEGMHDEGDCNVMDVDENPSFVLHRVLSPDSLQQNTTY